MILSGWKEIAQHLRCGVRSAQRREALGLPIKRPFPGRRSAVLAESEELDSWQRDSAFWKKQDWNILASVQRARELRAEVKQARELLRSRMNALRKELSEIRKKRVRRLPQK